MAVPPPTQALLIISSVVLSCSAVQIKSKNATEQTTDPIMMFAHGCSGTTAGIDILRNLIIAHDGMIASGEGELMKTLDLAASEDDLRMRLWTSWDHSPEENERISAILQAKSLREKVEIVYKAAQKRNETILFKNELSEGHDHPDVVEYLQKVGTRLFLLLRANLLDDLACRVKDFCDKSENEKLGYNVDGTGKQIGCEFRGRGEEEKQQFQKASSTSVYLDVDELLPALEFQEYMDGLHSNFLEKLGFSDVETFSSEDLFAFEYGDEYAPDGFRLSTARWKKLLSNVGVRPNEDTIRAVLKDYGTYPAPKAHREVFWNFDDLEKALRGTKYYDMIRM